MAASAATNAYEEAALLHQYLLFHYGEPSDQIGRLGAPNEAFGFPARCISENLDSSRLSSSSRGLDLGCAVGRATFELSRYCGEVVGIDLSKNFIAAANQLKLDGNIPCLRIEEGRLQSELSLQRPSGVRPERVRFEVGDAADLRPDLGAFDVVLCANILCRMVEPRRLLLSLGNLVQKGGQLIITSPYTWLDEYTPEANWLGGVVVDERPIFSSDSISTILEPCFTLIKRREMPFIIREHSRKFQYSWAEATCWIRKSS